MSTGSAQRFSEWGANSARLLLSAVVAIMLLAILAVRPIGTPPAAPFAPAIAATATNSTQRDNDLQLYESVIAQVATGESYYQATLAEQRARSFPVRPGFAVRLPTLASIQAWIGPAGTMMAALMLFGAIGWAWWRRFGDEGASPSQRRFGAALVLAGSSFLLNAYYHALHELWAGGLMALALGLHRPGKWVPALAFAALALAIRELALPFVLLMAAMAAWRRDWNEASAWAALALVFAALLGWHHSVVAGHTLDTDRVGPSWLGLRGLTGWTGNLVQSSQLHFLPAALGAPVLILALLGWAGWRAAAGTTSTLLLLGYGLAFMIAGRDNNFYWGLIVTPLSFAGLAFVPMVLRDLRRAAVPAGG